MNKKRIKHFAFIMLAFAAVVVACMELKTINVNQPQSDGSMAPRIQAGETATFVVGCELKANADVPEGRKLIVGMLAPRDWKIAENVTMSAQASSGTDPIVHQMKVIPNSTQPKNMQGRSWPEALMERFGLGSNRYNDMEWVAWMAEDAVSITNGDHFVYDVTVKCKVGMSNLKACLGFVINHDDDGLSSDDKHFKYAFSEPFTVYGGEGDEIDYTMVRFNSVLPSRALQNDIVTFTFNGDAYDNPLIDADEVYFRGEAVDAEGNTYPSRPRLMPRETTFTHVYNCTFWPRKFFNVPADKTIVAIRYEYTNADGSVRINKSQEAIISGATPAVDNEPYTFNLRCD
ncbi:MAG: DUF4961 domain-containing protein [Muribaculaceae bacterium]|nr:DUF4961 domain-containing protein [Muribaculaceae bacterium]